MTGPEPPNVHEVAGLIRGKGAWYAQSLGDLYWWLDKVILDATPQENITAALLLNFHIGMQFCYRENDKPDKKAHCIALYSPNPDSATCLISKIAKRYRRNGKPLELGVCSSAVVAEAYAKSTGNTTRFMQLGYNLGKMKAEKKAFQTAVERRTAEVANFLSEDAACEHLSILREATDLPLTCIYLRFHSPITPKYNNSEAEPISEILAMGIYEPTYPIAPACTGIDLLVPTQVLLSGDSSETAQRIENLIGTYRSVLGRFREDTAEKPGRLFVAYYREDFDLALEIQERLESALPRYDVVDGMTIAGLGEHFLDNFENFAPKCDYSLSLVPRDIKRGNVVFEHGYFVRRLGRERALLAGYRSTLPGILSDEAAKIHIQRKPLRRSSSKDIEREAQRIVDQVLHVIPKGS